MRIEKMAFSFELLDYTLNVEAPRRISLSTPGLHSGHRTAIE
jgi:hypothetical protein